MGFVLQLMKLLLCQNLLHQTVLKQGQKYVVKNHHQKRYFQIQMMVPMVTVMIMGMEKMGQARMEKMGQREWRY